MIFRKRILDLDEEHDTLNSLLSKSRAQLSSKDRDITLVNEKLKKLIKSKDQLQRTNEMLRLNFKEMEEESQEKDRKIAQVSASIVFLFDHLPDYSIAYLEGTGEEGEAEIFHDE